MPNDLLDYYRRSLAAQGIDDPRDDYSLTRDFLGPIAEANPKLFEDYPSFATEYRAIREANSPGTFGGIANTARTAFDRSRQALNTIGGVDAEDVAAVERQIQDRPSSVPWEDWQRSEGVDAAKVFARDPVEITSNIIAAGLAGSLPAIAGGISAGAVGAAAGGPAAPVTGTIGAMAGTGAGSLAVEYGSKFLDVLRESGADLTDPESIRRALADPETVLRAKALALSRGIPVAVFDAASAGIAGRFVRGVSGLSSSEAIRRGLTEASVQGAMGGAGEVAGAVSAGEQVRPGAVFEEIVGELGPGLAEVGGAAARRSMQNPFRREATSPFAAPVTPVTRATPTVSPLAPPDTGAAEPAVRPRSSMEILAAADGMDDATAAARLAELRAIPARTPDQESELQILLARAPATPSAPAIVPTSASAEAAAPDGGNLAKETGAAVPLAQPESDYLYTVQREQPHPTTGEIVPGFVQIDAVVNGGRGDPLTDEQRAALPQPPAWLPTGQYRLEQITEAIAKGPPDALQIQKPDQSVLRQERSAVGLPPVVSGDAIQGTPGEIQETVAIEKPAAPVAPKEAAPEVAAQSDIPKPSAIAPVVPSTATAPEEVAAIQATEAKAPEVVLTPELLARTTYPELSGQKVALDAMTAEGESVVVELDAAEAWAETQKRRNIYQLLLGCLSGT